MQPDDPYSRVDYRRLIAWPERIEREWPFLQKTFGGGGRLLDLGCGTGEHSRFLASKGFDVTGVDSSPAMIEKRPEITVTSSSFEWRCGGTTSNGAGSKATPAIRRTNTRIISQRKLQLNSHAPKV